MTTDLLTSFSNQLADAVAAAAPSVVQVQGRRRPASGLVYADNVVLTTVRALGREDGLHVRRDDGRTFDAELAGWDPTTSLAVLRVAGLGTKPIAPAAATPARRPSGAGRRALLEQRRHRQRRHRVGDRRSAADRPPPRHRPGVPHDRADARRLCRRRVPRHRPAGCSASRRPPRSAASASSSRRRSRGRRPRRCSSTAAQARISRACGTAGRAAGEPAGRAGTRRGAAGRRRDERQSGRGGRRAGRRCAARIRRPRDLVARGAPGSICSAPASAGQVPLRVLRGGKVADLTVTIGERPEADVSS